MPQEIQLVLQAAENGSRRDVPGLWSPTSTIAHIMESMQSELVGVSLENATIRYLQMIVPQSRWFKTTLSDMGLTQGGRALLILQLGLAAPPPSTSAGQCHSENQTPKPTDLEKALQLMLDSNFDADSKVCVITIMKVLDNILQKPDEPKVRTIRMANGAFATKVVRCKGGVEFLIACGFQVVDVPPPSLSHMDTGEKCLVLAEENEHTQHLVKARRLLTTKAIEELGLKADELPKYKPPTPLTNSVDPTSTSALSFNPYKGHRYDAKSAAAGQNLGPDGDYISPTEQQLQALQSAQALLENSFHKPILDREVQASLPNSTLPFPEATDSTASDTTLGGPSDGSMLAKQLQKRELDRRQREEQGFTTKAMRDLEKLKKQKVYSHAQIRVQFSDGSVLEAKFLPKETIAVIKAVVMESLLMSNLDFDLYVAPPRRKLSETSTLEEQGLVPAAKIFLSWKVDSAPDKGSPVGSFLKPELFRSGGEPVYPTAKSVLPDENEKRTAKKSKAVDDGGSKPNREDELLRRMLGEGGLGGKPKSEQPSETGKPKWFKG